MTVTLIDAAQTVTICIMAFMIWAQFNVNRFILTRLNEIERQLKKLGVR